MPAGRLSAVLDGLVCFILLADEFSMLAGPCQLSWNEENEEIGRCVGTRASKLPIEAVFSQFLFKFIERFLRKMFARI